MPWAAGNVFGGSGGRDGREQLLGAFMAPEEAALAAGRFERAFHFIAAGVDPALVGQAELRYKV